MFWIKEYACLAAAVVVVWMGANLWQRHSMSYGFEMIGPDDPIEKVVWVMGAPDGIRSPKPRGPLGCVREYDYRSPLYWFDRHGWVIGFDKDDRVVLKKASSS